MRLISPGATPPADVDKYLLPHEQQVITVRRHPAVLIGSIGLTAAGLIVAAVLSDTFLKNQSTLLLIVWLAWGLLMLRLITAAATWRSTTSWSPRTGSSSPPASSPGRWR